MSAEDYDKQPEMSVAVPVTAGAVSSAAGLDLVLALFGIPVPVTPIFATLALLVSQAISFWHHVKAVRATK